MKKSITTLVLCFTILLLSGCGEKVEEGAAQEEELRQVSAYTIHKEKLVSHIEIFGTLEPQSQTTLAAEVSGTVSWGGVEEGDLVSVGQELTRFAAGDNFIQLGYQNALQNYDNAQKLYDLTFRSAQRDEENARIALEQSEISLGSATVSEEKTGVSLVSQVESAQKSVEIAQTNVEIAELALDNLIKNNEQAKENLQKNSKTTVHSALIAFEDMLLFADGVLGVTTENDAQRKVYGVYLSIYDRNLLVRTTQDWKVKNNSVSAFRNSFDATTQEDWNNLEQSKIILDKGEQVAEELRAFLIQFEEVLTNSRIGGGLTTTELSRLKSQTSSYQTSLESQVSSLISLQQSIDNFLLTAPQNEQNSELSLLSAQNQLEQAKQRFIESEASSDVQRTNTSSQRENAEKSLESAENNLQSIREKNAIQIQNAIAQLDSAGNQLEQASLELKKTTVVSPVSGIVVSKFVEVGDTVSAGSPLFVIAEIDTLSLKGSVDPDELSALRLVEKGIVEIENFGEVVGVLTRSSPVADINTRQVTVEIDVKNYDRSIPANIFATAKFAVPQNKDVLLVPFKSLIAQNPAQVFILSPQGSNVFVVEKRTLELGDEHGEYIEVVSGLEVRDKIAKERVLGLQEGDRVSIMSTPEEPSDKNSNELKNEENPEENKQENTDGDSGLKFGKDLSL